MRVIAVQVSSLPYCCKRLHGVVAAILGASLGADLDDLQRNEKALLVLSCREP